MAIVVEVIADKVKARLAQLQAAASDLSPAYAVIGSTLVNRIRLGFRNSRSPGGTSWLPIKFRAPRRNASGAFTGAGKAQRAANATGKAGKPLEDTGALRRSIVPKVTADGVEVGTNLKVKGGQSLGAIHQFGATVVPKSGKYLAFAGPAGQILFSRRSVIPARPFMPLTPTGELDLPPNWEKAILRNLAAHFQLKVLGA